MDIPIDFINFKLYCPVLTSSWRVYLPKVAQADNPVRVIDAQGTRQTSIYRYLL
jgi:hypothetical protein